MGEGASISKSIREGFSCKDSLDQHHEPWGAKEKDGSPVEGSPVRGSLVSASHSTGSSSNMREVPNG